jgi:hypothetical protein
MKSALMRPPFSEYSTRARRVNPRLPPSPRAQLPRVDADRVRRAVGRVGVGLVGGLDDRADAAVPEQVDRRPQDRADHVVGRRALLVGAERRARLGRELDRLDGAREHTAALRDLRAVVVVPGGARQLEQPLALLEGGRRVR